MNKLKHLSYFDGYFLFMFYLKNYGSKLILDQKFSNLSSFFLFIKKIFNEKK